MTFVNFQLNCTAEETVESKHVFERFALSHGVSIRKYRADNGSFNTRVFKESITAANQRIDFCAAYAHHQNSIVERMIQTITFRARSQLIHAMQHWPDVITSEFWPYPIKMVVDVHNNSPASNGLAPVELFTGIKRRANLSFLHPFGCPAFVLDKINCTGGRTPKWNPRSEQGVYLGLSPDHASNVGLIYNITTRHVSPQYHVVYDDDFTSVTHKTSPTWPKIFDRLYQTSRDEPPDGFIPPATSVPAPSSSSASEGDSSIVPTGDISSPLLGPTTSEPVTTSPVPSPSLSEGDPVPVTSPRREGAGPQASADTRSPAPDDPNTTPQTRNGRRIVKPVRYRHASLLAKGLISRQTALTANSIAQRLGNYSLFQARMDHSTTLHTLQDGTENLVDPRILAASMADKDTMHYGQAMQAHDKADFIKAMEKEVNDLNSTGVWKLVRKSEMPKDAKLIRLIWSFKRKRNPLGQLIKHKARLCVHGGMQRKGIDYWHTYAPVVNWSTVKMVLLLTTLAGWYSRQIDYVLAFSQAPIDADVFCHLPAGFHINGGDNDEYVIQLVKNLYGTKQAAANWFEMMKQGLEEQGFKSSKTDPCLFLRNDAIIVTYVDDCLIFSKDKNKIDQLLDNLRKIFKLTDEGADINAFLGIKVDKGENGSITMTQPALIKRILNDLSLLDGNCKLHDTPANVTLNKMSSGEERNQTWNYRSVIGMMMFLASSTRPDILFAVHQCAKFNSCPKRVHEEAVKRIGRYLKRTMDKGTILTPNGTHKLDCYVDADFAGCFDHEISDDRSSVLSRTGYSITYSGCPLLCVSKMQTEIALSTTEAEYIALSQSMRDLIPLRSILMDLSKIMHVNPELPVTHSTVFEDNNGALELAQAPKYRPRTKHIAIKYHHFREHVKNKSIRVEAIHTKEQLADIFTKPLEKHQFEYLRKKLIGW